MASVKIPFKDAVLGADEVFYDHYAMTTKSDYVKLIDAALDQHYGAILVEESFDDVKCDYLSELGIELPGTKPFKVSRAIFDDVQEALDQMHYEIGSALSDDDLDKVRVVMDGLTATLLSPKLGGIKYRIYDLSTLKDEVDSDMRDGLEDE